MASRQPVIVEVTRGPIVESVHQVMVVVANEHGNVIKYWGNPQYLTIPRSAIKMLQALPVFESGAVNSLDLSDIDITLLCASHRGEKKHLEALTSLAEKMGVSETSLVCAPHLPYDELSSHEYIRRGQAPTCFCNNCAGKHLGMIATAKKMGEPVAGYEKYDHPVQERIRRVLSETLRVDHSKIAYGIDGCGVPTYGVPLQSLAVGMSTFINSKENLARKAIAFRILNAIRNHPFYLAGSDNFATAVIEKSQGRAIIKTGAEGVICGVLPEMHMAFAVKAADGAGRAAQVAAAALLLQLGGLNVEEFKALSKFTQPIISNWKGEPVGQIRIARAG